MSDETSAPKLRVQKSQLEALSAILAEREAQDAKWGLPNHDPAMWQLILCEEMGEFSKAALELRAGELSIEELIAMKQKLRKEAVQIAAVGMAMVECMDRGLWNWASPTEIVED